MGTQQILLIVLSVIIVGVAIAVGISMFNSQAYNSNKSGIAADAQSFATQIVQYYKTPESQGGYGGGDIDSLSVSSIAGYLGFDATTFSTTNENGKYTISTDGTSGYPIITGVGSAEKGGYNPQIITTVELPSGEITAVASDVEVETEG
ncbi:MAG: hypothetical protein PHN71_00070 [Candidatus Cloacimonetes bacterium]|jgi:hypothetical protein|nr:hypothetical protein [Candidatus Cloacimonadota bacterium]MDD4686954.1 hypothetical protein [Candidatus Cloacimonadota bacterium]MDY0298504.1 hypothetical protein [Candidatus Cloacimonadaceae bacterium]